MKSNTLIHFGTSAVKYSIYQKAVSAGQGKRPDLGPLKQKRYFLRATPSEGVRSLEARITKAQVEECWNLLPESAGMALIEARCAWAANVVAEAKRRQSIQLQPREHASG